MKTASLNSADLMLDLKTSVFSYPFQIPNEFYILGCFQGKMQLHHPSVNVYLCLPVSFW